MGVMMDAALTVECRQQSVHISPLLCSSFNLYTDSWAMPWVDSLALRFRNSSSAAALPDRPRELVPLYSGTHNFDSTVRLVSVQIAVELPNNSPAPHPLATLEQYNTGRNATIFATPAWATRAQLFAVITGHGSDNNGCGEFCVTSHVFFVNGHVNNLTFADAGTEWGCTASVPYGGIPNEHGA